MVMALLGYAAAGAGVAAGAAWGAANVWAMTGLLKAVTMGEGNGPSRRALLLWGVVKFPLLYGGGYLILRWGRMPVESLLGGFSLLFLVWGGEAIWRSIAQSKAGHAGANHAACAATAATGEGGDRE